jgi:hypothetical protein
MSPLWRGALFTPSGVQLSLSGFWEHSQGAGSFEGTFNAEEATMRKFLLAAAASAVLASATVTAQNASPNNAATPALTTR